MTRDPSDFARRYLSALQIHLKRNSRASLEAARQLGSQAFAAGIKTLGLAKLHEQILVADLLPTCPAVKRAASIRQAGVFLAVAITSSEEAQGSTPRATLHLQQLVKALNLRMVDSAAYSRKLSLEIIHRKAVEATVKKKERHYAKVLKESGHLQEQLRRLSRQILSAQEDERKEISRELHDIVAQSLTGINVRLTALKKEAAVNVDGLDENIASTQRLVEDSVNIVHRFARELRPAVLDDLGLIPALHSFMKNFTERTGVHTALTAFAGVEQLKMARRTVLFRVAQEALTNVARHAQASRVEVSIQQTPNGICMTVADDGKSFQVQRVLLARGGKRLGLLGMRERLEMVGGIFQVKSEPGKGTTIAARIPFPAAVASAGKQPAGRTSTI
jgi:signal transduction histidine kinase